MSIRPETGIKGKAMFLRQKNKELAKDCPLRGSSGEEYETPDYVFRYYDHLHHGFYYDVCGSKVLHKVRRYFTSETDALKQNWIGNCWMNAPYAKLRPWVEKAWRESMRGATVVGLLPVWSGDAWFHEFCVPYANITLINHRLRFTGPTSKGFNATFPSMIAVWPKEAAIIPPSAKQLTIYIDDPRTGHVGMIPRTNPTIKREIVSSRTGPTQEGVVLSLFDRTGNLVRPWAEAGFECIAVDLQHPPGQTRRGLVTYIGADLRGWWPPLRRYKIVLAQPPCTNLAVSGAAQFRQKGIDGLTAGLELVQAARRICEWSEVPWLIENPTSILSSHWREPDFVFHPHEFGGYLGGQNDGYTKRTCLWTGGGFRFPEKRPIPVTRPNFIHHMSPSPDRGDLRSITPPGFSRAVFEANQ
jgi:phage N-6-adenine-methyltransferase